MTIPAEHAAEEIGSPYEGGASPGRFGAATLGAPPPTIAPLPEPDEAHPRRKRRLLTWGSLVVVLVLLAGALVGGRIWGRHGTRSVWMVTRDIAAGQELHATDVRTVRAADALAAGAMPVSAAPVGQVATRSLPAGSILRAGALGRQAAVPFAGSALVGVALPAGTAPLREIVPGDPVAVLKLPPPPTTTTSGSPAPLGMATVILRRVEVISLSGSGSGEVVTVAVPQSAIPVVTALSAANRIAIVRVP